MPDPATVALFCFLTAAIPSMTPGPAFSTRWCVASTVVKRRQNGGKSEASEPIWL
ncbi:MAG: hypothetical protein IGS50_15660 [Synechococcales cyanobacterium C42_A2020_086]|nr:hypothetical protein [Synechococcales cyanobacterium C42_A2020_086]